MTSAEWARIQWFKPHEFDDPTAPGSGARMEFSIVKLLDELRVETGTPMHINSGFRTVEHNAAVGGKDGSAHITGHAADVHTPNLQAAISLACRACMHGARRVGVDLKGRYVHIDTSPFNPAPAVWFYNA